VPRTAYFVLFLLLALLVSGLAAAVGRAQGGGGRYYPETGQTLAGQFVGYFDGHGGLALFGYPLAPAEQEGGRLVQYLERARLEYHSEHVGTPYEVELGL